MTEDSDVFLFGGECIYKNMFDEKKFVEVYLAEDAKRELGVSRSEFVCLAYLLGSDYAEGVRGVGIVNAMEILDTFGGQRGDLKTVETGTKGVEGREEGGFMARDSSMGSPNSDERTKTQVEAATAIATVPEAKMDVGVSAIDVPLRKVTADCDTSSRRKKHSLVLQDVLSILDQFKTWLHRGHDFQRVIAELRGEVVAPEDVCASEHVVKLVSDYLVSVPPTFTSSHYNSLPLHLMGIVLCGLSACV